MLRTAHPIDADGHADDGITVAEAARIIGADVTTVRALVQIGELEGWRVGKTAKPTAIRVSAESCRDYRQRNRISGPRPVEVTQPGPAPRPATRRGTAIAKEMLASLRAKGFRI